MKGIIILNKPKGISSSSAVGKVRRILGTRDVGHMGTLDPAGEGILIIGIGKATRLFDFFLTKDKVYEAEFCFGYETDTLDGDGKVINQTDIIPKDEDVIAATAQFVGEMNQLPPKYSAKNVDGHRAYDLARQGKEFELDTKAVTVYDFKFLEKTCENTFKMQIHCSSGTYIRSLCRDLAYSLNSLATMISIKRTKSGQYSLKDSFTIEELAEKKEEGMLNVGGANNCFDGAIISVECAIESLPKVELGEEYYMRLVNGVKIAYIEIENYFSGKMQNIFSVFCAGELFGIGEIKEEFLKVKTYLRN